MSTQLEKLQIELKEHQTKQAELKMAIRLTKQLTGQTVWAKMKRSLDRAQVSVCGAFVSRYEELRLKQNNPQAYQQLQAQKLAYKTLCRLEEKLEQGKALTALEQSNLEKARALLELINQHDKTQRQLAEQASEERPDVNVLAGFAGFSHHSSLEKILCGVDDKIAQLEKQLQEG